MADWALTNWATARDQLGPRRAWLLPDPGALVWALLTEANVMDAAEGDKPAADLLFDAFPDPLPRHATPEQVEARRERWEDAIERLLVVVDRELENGSPIGEWIAIFARSIKVGPGVFGLAWIEWQTQARMWLAFALVTDRFGGAWHEESAQEYARSIPSIGRAAVYQRLGYLLVTFTGQLLVPDVEKALRMVAPRGARFSVEYVGRERLLVWQGSERPVVIDGDFELAERPKQRSSFDLHTGDVMLLANASPPRRWTLTINRGRWQSLAALQTNGDFWLCVEGLAGWKPNLRADQVRGQISGLTLRVVLECEPVIHVNIARFELVEQLGLFGGSL